jgi:hypothetical protein
MKIRLYLDEDAISHSLVTGLRARGIDVMTTLEKGRIGLEIATKSAEEMQGQVELCIKN